MSELIGTVNYMARVYYVYRAPGNPHDKLPFYFGISLGRDDNTYCAYASLKSLFMAEGFPRVEFKSWEGDRHAKLPV